MSRPVSYHKGKFPPSNIDFEKLLPSIGSSNAALAKYDAILSVIPNAKILITPLITQEAVLSSKIEGTQATIGEVFEYEAGGNDRKITTELKSDIDEIINYRIALSHASDLLKNLPFCQRVLRETHKVLLQGVRGHGKSPGMYRRIPNWIGSKGCSIEDARFIPINANEISDAMSKWEKYINNSASNDDKLLRVAIIHAELEALHPFLDGNGRIGRICIPLIMFNYGLIHRPIFYISEFFEKNREEYYDRLLSVSRDDNWTDWCIFFLNAVKAQAEKTYKKTLEILRLYDLKKDEFISLTHSQHAVVVLDYIFANPIFKVKDIERNIDGVSYETATGFIKKFKQKKIIKVLREAQGRKPAIYIFRELLNIVEGENML